METFLGGLPHLKATLDAESSSGDKVVTHWNKRWPNAVVKRFPKHSTRTRTRAQTLPSQQRKTSVRRFSLTERAQATAGAVAEDAKGRRGDDRRGLMNRRGGTSFGAGKRRAG